MNAEKEAMKEKQTAKFQKDLVDFQTKLVQFLQIQDVPDVVVLLAFQNVMTAIVKETTKRNPKQGKELFEMLKTYSQVMLASEALEE